MAQAPPVLRVFVRGMLKALLLLGLVSAVLLAKGNARWAGVLSGGAAANALALGAGVGFAEELLFRGWLQGELGRHLGANRALTVQAVVFALVHPWYRLPVRRGCWGDWCCWVCRWHCSGGPTAAFSGGAVGMHGGLVGGAGSPCRTA